MPNDPGSRHRILWAKSATQGPGHSLLGHLIDVGLAAEKLLSESRVAYALVSFAEDLRISVEDARRLIVILVALHDLGKAIPPFQAKWKPGAPEEAFARPVDDVPHGRASAILLNIWLRELGVPGRVARILAHAVGVHHGVLFGAGFEDGVSERSLGEERAPWPSWRGALIQDVIAAFGPLPQLDRQRAPLRAKSWAWLAGLTAVADWIGSGLPHRETITNLEAYVAERRQDLDLRLEEIGWPADEDWWQAPDQPKQIASWFSTQDRTFEPRPLQEVVEQLLTEDPDDQQPKLWIVEAPMGEGKTEAAFFTIVRSPKARGAYVAMPTQATSDALYGRLASFVERHRRRPVQIALAHGGAQLVQAGAASRAQPSPAAGVDDDLEAPIDPEGVEAHATQATWLSTNRRELLAELGVGTGDQALLGVLPTRHHFVRLWALSGKVVVFDEVHAYETYTEGLIVELLRWLAAMGSTVVLMSATLPEGSRQQLVAAYQEGAGWLAEPPPQAAYPRVTVATSKGVDVRSFSGTRHMQVDTRPAPHAIEELGPHVLELYERGGAVGVVVNQVGRAQDLYAWCRAHEIPALLLHGRMPLKQRKELESELLLRFGPESKGERHGLVIATQVVEQSLDVDFDVLVSDLAPIDLILQRVGREHRHDRKQRGAHGVPVLYVAGLGGPTHEGPEPEALTSVYDPYLLWRSWAVLNQAELIDLPGDIDAWVQLVYGERAMDALVSFEETVSMDAQRYEVRRQMHAMSADQWKVGSPSLPAADVWTCGVSDDEERRPGLVRAPTRLGEPSVSVVPVFARGRCWHLPEDAGSIAIGGGRGTAAWGAIAAGYQVRISRRGLVQQLLDVPRPAWWLKLGLLRYLVPLVLDEEGRSTLDPRVRLDPELGLIYPSREEKEA